MKIALLGSRSSIHLARWADALAGRGHRVELLTMHPGGDPTNPAVQVTPLPFSAPWGYLLNARPLKRLLRDLRPDVLHVHYASGYGTLGQLSGFAPLILSVWGSDVYDFPAKSPFHRWLLQRNLAAADRLCSTSCVMAEQTRSLLAGDGRIDVVPFGVDLHRFSPVGRSRKDDSVVIGTVKSLSFKYGVDTLLRAFAEGRDRLRQESPRLAAGLSLLVVGDGPDRKALERLAFDLGLQAAVKFAGRVPHDQVVEHLAQMDVFVAASRLDSESFGVAVVEAEACGLPVVVSRVGGLPEVVTEGEAGFVVEKENSTALAEALLHLVRDRELRSRMGKAGRELVERRFDWQANVDRMEAIYIEVVGTHGR